MKIKDILIGLNTFNDDCKSDNFRKKNKDDYKKFLSVITNFMKNFETIINNIKERKLHE